MLEQTSGKDLVALIIPAFNEAQRIGAVIEAAQSATCVDEIIVVNDGSIDNTAAVVSAYDVKLIDFAVNRGKGCAMQAGINATDAPILTFSDADILGITKDHFDRMIRPLKGDPTIAMTVGKFSGGRLRTDLSQNLIPAISGQRAWRRSLLPGMPDLSNSRFAVELIITRYAKSIGASIKEVTLNDLTHVMKEEKLGMVKGFSARLKMYQDMFKSIKQK